MKVCDIDKYPLDLPPDFPAGFGLEDVSAAPGPPGMIPAHPERIHARTVSNTMHFLEIMRYLFIT